ncbi:MAG: ATP-binding cassette domain-containing protein, partial [SAR324 cluster bacterium]|nr:ATP-binding cassette domain-containing protein [SAR324 cluster bacterium]
MDLLKVDHLSVDFVQGSKPFHAVRDVSLSIKKGETLALVGESGSGKSVTAHSVMGLLPPSAKLEQGTSILFDGQELLKKQEKELQLLRGNRIGMIFQEPLSSLNPLHTIGKQIAETLQLHQGTALNQLKKKVVELLERVEIQNAEEKARAYPHELSGGQRQRVMIAMAIANDPDLLIADEPTTALDVTVQAQVLALIRRLQNELGMAILLITHDLGIVKHHSDRVAVMKEGQIVETEETSTLFQNPIHPYTRKLLDSEPKAKVLKTNPNAKALVESKKLKVWFPIRKGVLKRTVGHIKAVDGINLTLREGESVGVVGESGSGKSTLGLAL